MKLRMTPLTVKIYNPYHFHTLVPDQEISRWLPFVGLGVLMDRGMVRRKLMIALIQSDYDSDNFYVSPMIALYEMNNRSSDNFGDGNSSDDECL